MPSLGFSFHICKGKRWVADSFSCPFDKYLLSSLLGSGDQVMAETRSLLSRSLQPGEIGRRQLGEITPRGSQRRAG